MVAAPLRQPTGETRVKFFASIVCVALSVASPALADTLTIGTGNSANAFPFGYSGTANPTTYQQVYAASAFGTAPLTISGLSFQRASGTVAQGTFTLSLSTTAKPVNGLDTSVFANNIGTDETQIFTGSLAGQLAGDTLGFTFAPFAYNPASGNLLVNINVTGFLASFGSFVANNGDAGGAYSRAHDFGSGFAGYGLKTTFTTGPAAVPGVPEAGVWLMMIAGFGLVGGALRRRPALRVAA